MRVLELLPAPAQTPAGWRHWATRMDAFCAKSAANEAERSLRTARWERVLRQSIQSKVQMLRVTFWGGEGGRGGNENGQNIVLWGRTGLKGALPPPPLQAAAFPRSPTSPGVALCRARHAH